MIHERPEHGAGGDLATRRGARYLHRLADGPARVTEIAAPSRCSLQRGLEAPQRSSGRLAGLIDREVQGRDHVSSASAASLLRMVTGLGPRVRAVLDRTFGQPGAVFQEQEEGEEVMSTKEKAMSTKDQTDRALVPPTRSPPPHAEVFGALAWIRPHPGNPLDRLRGKIILERACRWAVLLRFTARVDPFSGPTTAASWRSTANRRVQYTWMSPLHARPRVDRTTVTFSEEEATTRCTWPLHLAQRPPRRRPRPTLSPRGRLEENASGRFLAGSSRRARNRSLTHHRSLPLRDSFVSPRHCARRSEKAS